MVKLNHLLNLEKKENNLKQFPVTGGGFHSPGNSKICFFVWYIDWNITIFY